MKTILPPWRIPPLMLLVGALIMALTSGSFAQQTGSVATFSGELNGRWQRDRFIFEVGPDQFQRNRKGRVDFVFVMSSATKSPLNPGFVSVVKKGDPLRANRSLGQRKNSPGSLSSFTVASLKPGIYEIIASPQKMTSGSYEINVYLAGDVNGDQRVDEDDQALINGLMHTRFGGKGYSLAADVNRNGIVNKADLRRAGLNLEAAAAAVEAEEAFLPFGALAFTGISIDETCEVTQPVMISLTGADFDVPDAGDFRMTVNGVEVPEAKLLVETQLITASNVFVDGKNEIHLKAYDTVGRPLFLDGVFWAGTSALTVNLRNPDGSPFLKETEVQLTLSDDAEVGAFATSSTGSVSFSGIPARTVLITAKGPGNETGSVGLVGNAGPAVITMEGFDPPSAIDNNDFSQGLAGWVVPGATGLIIPHEEIVGPGEDPTGLAAMADVANQDLSLGTSGMGEQSAGRCFSTKPGTTGVRARYRFITSEVPGGYFGSKYNDYFRVTFRSQKAGKQVTHQNSMNAMGLGAFDFASGSTSWRDVILAVDKGGDVIQFDAAVANVGDGALDSQVVIDFLEEVSEPVMPHLAWNNAKGGIDLTYEVGESGLTEPVEIKVSWAAFPSLEDVLGSPVHTVTVPAGTGPGSYPAVHIEGSKLTGNPFGMNCIIAYSGPTNIATLQEVTVSFGANADASVVSAAMDDANRDSLRVAGQSHASINSTLRTAEDQARAMFNNLTKSSDTIANNVLDQRAEYAAAGEKVIDVFVEKAGTKTRQEILSEKESIKDDMEAKINELGPSNVSKHCGDPKKLSVIDVGKSVFNASNSPLYAAYMKSRVNENGFLDEKKNNCFHSELTVTTSP